jgi:hypothetical protein
MTPVGRYPAVTGEPLFSFPDTNAPGSCINIDPLEDSLFQRVYNDQLEQIKFLEQILESFIEANKIWDWPDFFSPLATAAKKFADFVGLGSEETTTAPALGQKKVSVAVINPLIDRIKCARGALRDTAKLISEKFSNTTAYSFKVINLAKIKFQELLGPLCSAMNISSLAGTNLENIISDEHFKTAFRMLTETLLLEIILSCADTILMPIGSSHTLHQIHYGSNGTVTTTDLLSPVCRF